MSSSRSLTSIDVSEYDRIEAAMSESERGRWFLDEYLRRNRSHDTGILLDAIARLETVVTGDRDHAQIGRVRGDVMDMAHAIARTKAEIAAINAPDQDQSRLGGASAALDAIVRSTERATSDILGAAEHIQEAAWTLRESGSDAAICDELDRRATAIYTACSFQDLTAQRTARILHTLRYLEERLAAMMSIWGDALEPVPASSAASGAEVPADLCQSEVDRYIDMEASSAEPIPPVGRLPDALAGADDIVFLEAQDDAEEHQDDAKERKAGPAAQADFDAHIAPVEPARLESLFSELSDEGSVAEPFAAPAEDAAVSMAEATVDPIAERMAAAADPVPSVERTDIASAFADIDALSDEEKRALFS